MNEFDIFCAGFAASREGFNGECPYEHLAPTSIFAGGRSMWVSQAEMRDDVRAMAELRRLFDAMVRA